MNRCYFLLSLVLFLILINCRTSSNCVNMQIQSAAASPSDIIRHLYPSPKGADVFKSVDHFDPTYAASTNAAHLGYCSLQRVRRLRYHPC